MRFSAFAAAVVTAGHPPAAAQPGVGQEPIVAAATDPAGAGRRAAGGRPPLPTQQPS